MISMIIVDYKSMDKTYEYIKDCLRSIKRLNHFVIVDNASKEAIAPRKIDFDGAEVYLVSSGVNAGYAKGNNLGAKSAKELWNDEYYIFSNNDLRFDKPFSTEDLIKSFGEDDGISVVGPKVIGLDGGDQNPLPDLTWRQMLFGHFLSLLPPKGMKPPKMTQAANGRCVAVVGAFMCAKASDFWNVGGFDENTFLFVEEMILSKRLEKIDKYMYYDDSIEIVHEHGTTVKSTIGIIKSLDTDFNSRYYYAKEYCNANGFWLLLSKVNYRIVIFLFRIKKWLKKTKE